MNEKLRQELHKIMEGWSPDRIKKIQKEIMTSKKKYNSDKDILAVVRNILQE